MDSYKNLTMLIRRKALKNIILILCFGIIISCSSNYKRPEALSSKMKRFSPIEEKVNLVPYSAPLSETMKFSRRPASVNTKRNKKKFGSTKTLYFLALFDQFQTLKSYSHLKMPNIEICPHFHNPLLKRKRVIQKKGRLNYSFLKKSHLNDDRFLSSTPELYLPITEKKKNPKVIDIIKKQEKNSWNNTIQKGISFHTLKTHRELKQLCNKGKSTNYYNFQNLMTFIRRSKNFSPSKKNLKVLLKTTLFSNMALISSLRKKHRSRGLASVKKIEKELKGQVLFRMKADWVEEYFKQIKNVK